MDTKRATEIATELSSAPVAHDGGKYVYALDGSGGEWYSAGAYGFAAGTVVIAARHGREWTAEEVVERFNEVRRNITATTLDDEEDALTGSPRARAILARLIVTLRSEHPLPPGMVADDLQTVIEILDESSA
jgi:hypothetical protein